MSNTKDRFSMQGRIALVTGASSGMGRHFVKTLAQAGAKVICAARRKDSIETIAAEIRSEGGQAVAIELDIGSTDSVTRAFDEAEKAFGAPVDALVNNAGQIVFAPFPDISDEQKQLILERTRARDEKQWERSDELREQLSSQGIGLNDTADGARWYYL